MPQMKPTIWSLFLLSSLMILTLSMITFFATNVSSKKTPMNDIKPFLKF